MDAKTTTLNTNRGTLLFGWVHDETWGTPRKVYGLCDRDSGGAYVTFMSYGSDRITPEDMLQKAYDNDGRWYFHQGGNGAFPIYTEYEQLRRAMQEVGLIA